MASTKLSCLFARKQKMEETMKLRKLILLSVVPLFALLADPSWLAAQKYPPVQENRPAHVRYKVTDLGTVGPAPGQAFFVTRNDLVAGAAAAPSGAMHAVLWLSKFKFDIGKRGLGGANSIAFGANAWGQAIGAAETSKVDPNGEDFCGFKALGLPDSGGSCLPFIWQFGAMTPLPTLGGHNGEPNQINSRGQVAGYAENNKVDPTCPAPQVLQFKPVSWKNGKVRELATFPGDPDGVALAINDNGQLAGGSGDCAPFSPQLLFSMQPLHALLWEPRKRTPIDLGNLGGTGHGFGNIALNMNNKGQVVGNSDLPGDTATHAFLWTREKGMQDLGTLPGDFISAGLGINDRAEVVGVSIDASFNLRAYLWQKGHMTDLNNLIPSDSTLSLILACSINSQGQIVGLAVDKDTGAAHAFLATPRW
jgi:probable HAF family extracellular repeat protein